MIALAQRFEAPDVERDVVVDEEDRPRAVAARVGDVGQHAVDAVGVEVAAAHLDDRAEAAVVGAAARGLDDVHLAAEQRVAAEHARGAVRQPQRLGREPRDRPVGVVHEAVRASGTTGRRSPSSGAFRFERAQQLAERLLAFAADDELDVVAGLVRTRREARVVAADDDARCRTQARGRAARS